MLVAVYGSLRKGLGNYRFHLKGKSTYIGSYDTIPEYNMYSLGAFPAITRGGNTSIVMEVFRVNEEVMKSLDRLEGYNKDSAHNHYNKEQINTPFGQAFVYVYGDITRLEEENKLSIGDWKEFLQNKSLYTSTHV
jgi:gamma-glutamylcyclotransferase (GGCT)/AIG2-like uncharacterized protein YtfP